MRFLSLLILKILGWKVEGDFPTDIEKCVVIVAPHTSTWDFVIGRLGYWRLGISVKFLIKKEMFYWPLGWFLKKMGGVPVDRQARSNLVLKSVEEFKNRESFILTITPEGTRSYNPNWKQGFYRIALMAKVPIVLTYLDYAKKTGGVGPIIVPSGDYEKDFKLIEDFYKDKTAKFPEKFNLSAMYQEK